MRKVLSFVLVLALVLSSFSMAFAADSAAGLTDITGNANEDAIQVSYDLDIVTGNPDGTFLPEKAVTRAEFAAMITRALAIPESALAGYANTTFKDTAGYGWAVPYLAFCQSKGIMLGDGAGNVMPGRTINMNEAITMALRAIGYTANSAELVGAWPSNYVTIGQNYGLYDDVAKVTNVNKAMAAQIIYNLLTVQKVVVNADGDTNWIWIDEDDEEPANLLNTNLGCTADEDVILGDDYDYDDAIINITDDIGAYGTAYLNEDDELVAFTKDSTALTGSVNDDGDFEVGNVTYEFGTNAFTSAAAFANTDDETVTGGSLSVAEIEAYAAANADDADTVTLNVEVSGKKIKDIYSVVAWEASETGLAADDVQEEITDDKSLLDVDFVQDDNDEIEGNSFQLVGVASLDKIAEDDVVYVYADATDDIRKVAVGTETVEGTIEEINTDNDVLTIGGKEYDVAYLDNTLAYDFDDNDVDGDGTFYLDAFGDIYDFDGTTAVDTYGVVKAATAETSFDNFKIKLYKSDDSTSTVYLAEEDPDDIDWTSTSATTISAVTAGALIGYSLDANGDIDQIDNTVAQFTSGTVFKSSKVVGTKSLDSNCVVFTYDGTSVTADTGSYDVATLSDIDAGTTIANATYEAFYILNDDGDVAAMFISSTFADTENDAVYGVINTRTSTTTDGDKVYKFTGFIDGTAFTYKTDDQTNNGTGATGSYNGLAGVFGVYAITTDASNQITKIADLTATYIPEDESGIIAAGVVADLGSDNTVITIGSNKYVAEDDAVVYKYDASDDEFTVSKLSAIDETDTVILYDTKGSDADGLATIVIFYEN